MLVFVMMITLLLQLIIIIIFYDYSTTTSLLYVTEKLKWILDFVHRFKIQEYCDSHQSHPHYARLSALLTRFSILIVYYDHRPQLHQSKECHVIMSNGATLSCATVPTLLNCPADYFINTPNDTNDTNNTSTVSMTENPKLLQFIDDVMVDVLKLVLKV